MSYMSYMYVCIKNQYRFIKSSWLPSKITTYLVISAGYTLPASSLKKIAFLKKISLVTFQSQTSISNFSDNLVSTELKHSSHVSEVITL